jgi:hypothetical protein
MSARAVEIDDRETIVVAGTIAALVLAAMYWASRFALSSQTPELLRSLGISLFILATPYWIWRAMWRRDSEFDWGRSQPVLTLVAIAFTAVIALPAGRFAAVTGIVLSVLGALSAALVLFSWLRNGAIRSRIAFSAGAAVMAAWAGGVAWTSRYKMPLYWEVFETSANVHHDPLYLVAIGNMLRTYGVPSTGLEGIPYAHYHYGSAWLFSRWSDLVQTDLLSFYSLGYVIIMVPLFLAAIAMLATGARKASRVERPHGWLRSNWWGWLALGIGTIGIIPDTALYAMAVWNAHVMISESYLASLPVFLMVIAAVISAWRGEKPGPVFLFVFLPVAIAALGFLKISMMVLMFALLIYAALRLRLYTRLAVVISIAMCAVAAYTTYGLVALPAHNGGIYPFHFMRYSTAEGWHQFFPLIHFAWTWVYIGGRLYELRVNDFASLVEAVRDRRMLDVELVLGLAVLGFLPGELLYIHGGSAIYFSDVQRWVALSLVIARAGHWVREWRSRRPVRAPYAGSIRLATVLAVFVAAPFVATMALNAVKPPVRMLRQNVQLRSKLISLAGMEPRLASGDRRLLFDRTALAAGLRRGSYYTLIRELRAIGSLPTSEKSDALLFIPQSYQRYWTMFDSDGRCTFVGFVAPALSEMAHLDGLPYKSCVITDQYNMQAYKPRDRDQVPADVTDAALCAKAERLGFHRVIVLDSTGGRTGRRDVRCAAPARPS